MLLRCLWFRVYPIQEPIAILEPRQAGRGYDFDTVTVIRVYWAGFRPINIPVPVGYFTTSEGGSSHLRYWRHNLLLILRHTCMVLEMSLHWPQIVKHWRRSLALGSGTTTSPVPHIPAESVHLPH